MNKIISLAGAWACRLDPGHCGVREGWWNGTVEEHRVTLPGTTQTNDIGPPCRVRRIGNLNPNTEHVGPAWYWRDLDLSDDDCRRHVALLLERVCWQSGERHAARQLRQSVLAYAASDAFRPSVATTAAEIARLIEAHQHAVPVPSRAEVEARFDRPARSAVPGI